MTRIFLLLPILLFSAPVMAAEVQTPVEAVRAAAILSGDEKERLELAEKMHDIWPIRTRMESALEAVANGFPEENRAKIKAAMRKSVKFDQLEEASIKAMAEIYTVPELKAMIEFYGSDMGKTISSKTPEYELALRPIIMQMIDKAMLDLRTGQQP